MKTEETRDLRQALGSEVTDGSEPYNYPAVPYPNEARH